MSAVAEVLQSSDEIRFSSFLNHAPIGFALCQRPGNITSTNSTFDDLLGLPSHQNPEALADLIQAQGGDESRRLLSELFQGMRESFQEECPAEGIVSKSRRWTAWPVSGDDDTAPQFAIVMLEDLTSSGPEFSARHQNSFTMKMF